MRWPFVLATYGAMFLILALYMTIVVASLTKVWGVDYRPDFRHYETAITRGIEAFMDTTFLSAVATPIAGVAGMVIAYLVVRKAFSGKEALDFMSNLGGAVPGTILGIGYILAFIKAPLIIVGIMYGLLAAYLAAAGAARTWVQVGLVILGSLLGQGLIFGLPWYAGDEEMRVVIYGLLLGGMGLYAEEIDVFFRPPSTMLGLTYAVLGVSAASALRGRWRTTYAVGLMALSYALVFAQEPLALVGTPYIIIAAYAVRSLPASVRAGVAALQQIDPAIEEASANLGADTGYTFRRIMLPLILPAFIAGLIFSFARYITSLSAIIFLTNPRWRILTALILSEVEQGGMSVAAAYSVLLIAVVFGAMGVMYAVTGRTFRGEEHTDVALAAG